MEAFEAIVTRVSPLKLTEPGPTPQEFRRIIEAATTAQREFERRGLDDRRKAVACVRKICKDVAIPEPTEK